MIGRTVDHYQFLEKLGAGGMGDIWKAMDTRLNRFVAVKVLTSSAAGNFERRRRFIQEAQAASALNHPNIITIHDIVSEGDTEFMVMEFVAGKTLVDLIPKGGLRVPQVLKYGVQMSDALQAAHAAGIIHRDLKPGNVMVTDSGLVKILDFGLAKLTDRAPVTQIGAPADATQTIAESPLTTEGSIIGTVSYMSPEQAQGKKVDTRSDIFSFGVVLYEMATGNRAFEGDNAVSTLSAILRDEVRSISEVSPDVPPQLEQVISRCLRKDPDDRWQTMKDVQMALAALKHESDSGSLYRARMPEIQPAPPPSAKPPAKAARKGIPAGLAAGIVAGVVVLGAIGGGIWWNKHGHQAQAPASAAAAVAAPAEPAAAPPPPDANAAPEPAAAPPPADASLTNDSIIDLVQAKVSPNLILSEIRASKTNFTLTPSELIRLTKAGVPDTVIEQMRNPKRAVSQALPATASNLKQPPPQATPQPQPAPAQPQPAPQAPAPPAAVQTPPPQPAPAPAPKPASVVAVTLSDGLPFSITLAEDIPENAEENRPLRFTVTRDVRIGDNLVIARGATVTGAIAELPGKKKFGVFGGGKMTLKLIQVDAVDGHKLAVRALAARKEEGTYRQVEPNGPRRSKGIVAPAGTEYLAYMDGAQTVSVTK